MFLGTEYQVWGRVRHADGQADGCSGAEVASICQDAALAAMNEDLEAPYVSRRLGAMFVGSVE